MYINQIEPKVLDIGTIISYTDPSEAHLYANIAILINMLSFIVRLQLLLTIELVAGANNYTHREWTGEGMESNI